MFDIRIDVNDVNHILRKHGLQAGGPVQKFFTSELMRLSDPYVPFRSGPLKNSVHPSDEWDAIIYNTPYARYHWFGKLMVDPITKKGAFYDPRSGRYWSRPNTPKELTTRDLQYTGGPLRGPKWVERCWIDNKDSIINSVEAYIGYIGGSK
jgi:hypothetical protein